MLTWMESHPLPFACTTNFGEHLDAATLRRFVFKVALDYLSPEQAGAAFRIYFGLAPPAEIATLTALTPGDFAVVRRKAALLGRLEEPEALAAMLSAECAAKPDRPGRWASGRRRGDAGFRGFRASRSPARLGRAEPAGQPESGAVRYERLKDIVKLAIRMQGLRGGVTLDEIQAEFAVGRRTAERMRDAVEWAFGPLEIADGGDNKRHWRLRSDALRRLAPLSAEELAELESAAETLERTGFEARAAALRELETKLRAAQRTDSLARIEADIEALVQAEGLAMRPGPRPSLDRDLLARLREAITTCRIVEVRYLSQSTGRHSRQRIEPYALLYGNRPFLVGRTDWNDAMRLWRLANMSEAHV